MDGEQVGRRMELVNSPYARQRPLRLILPVSFCTQRCLPRDGLASPHVVCPMLCFPTLHSLGP